MDLSTHRRTATLLAQARTNYDLAEKHAQAMADFSNSPDLPDQYSLQEIITSQLTAEIYPALDATHAELEILSGQFEEAEEEMNLSMERMSGLAEESTEITSLLKATSPDNRNTETLDDCYSSLQETYRRHRALDSYGQNLGALEAQFETGQRELQKLMDRFSSLGAKLEVIIASLKAIHEEPTRARIQAEFGPQEDVQTCCRFSELSPVTNCSYAKRNGRTRESASYSRRWESRFRYSPPRGRDIERHRHLRRGRAVPRNWPASLSIEILSDLAKCANLSTTPEDRPACGYPPPGGGITEPELRRGRSNASLAILMLTSRKSAAWAS